MAGVLFTTFFLLLLIGAPIVFAIAMGTAGSLMIGGFSLAILPQMVFSGLAHFPYLAVPLFVLAGMLMETGGISKRIVDLANALVGHIRGGMGMVVMVATIFFSDISGSSAADTAAIGSVMIPPMKKRGYDASFAAALVTAAAGMGVLIPPCLTMVVFGSLTNTSIGALFLAGFVPGISMGLILMVLTYIIARKKNLPREKRATFWELLVAVKRSLLSLFMGVIILGGIILGIFTATEAAAVSVAAALAIGIFGRRLSVVDFKLAMSETVVQTASIFFVAIGAKMFATFIALTGATNSVVAWMGALGLSQWSLLLAAVLLYLVMGMFLDPLGILLLTLPVLVPLMQGTGIDLIWFGVIVVKMLEVGLITPPVGFNVFVIHTATDGKVPVDVIFSGVWRFLAIEIFVIAALLAFPAISTWLPRTM
jgi:C4-dicarboxylate transporter, DctM subunit